MEKENNKLICIGYLGVKRCYLNIPQEEALQRYKEQEGDNLTGVTTTTIEFQDEFGVYDAYTI